MVRGDVVHDHRQHVLVRVLGAQHRDPDRQFRVQLEAMAPLDVELLLQPRLADALRAAHRNLDPDRAHNLIGHAVQLDVAGAQDFVPREDIADGGDQRVDVPRTGQLGREGNVVDRAGPVQAVGEPAAQLRRRQRHRLVVCGCDQPGARLRQLARAQLVDPLRQQAHGGELEHVADAEFHTALRADRGDQLGGDQRVAAQIEERVVDAHPLVSEQPREQLGDPDFGGVVGSRYSVPAASCGCGSAARSIF